jgi:hypothetical protein
MNVGIQSQRVWRHKRGYQNLQIEDGQTTQWLCEKGQKDKQWSTKLHISSYKPVMSWMRKIPGNAYDTWNIFVVICDIEIQ